jgi:hypothetical protein
MVTLKVKLKNRSKPLTYNVKTVKEARRTKKFVGKEGKVTIISRGKEVK